MEKKFAFVHGYLFRTALLFAFLCAVHFSRAQVLTTLQNSFYNTKKQAFKEKLYLHVSKSAFLTNETIWFKIYASDAGNNKPSDISKVVYVEVLDANHIAVLQTKIAMTGGTGDGYFQIPALLGSGNYQLRAYTSWMKNFDPGYYFTQTITVNNPLKAIAQAKSKAVSYDIQFFPEGGHLVAGLNSHVAFKVTASDGKTVDATGAILDQRNDTISRFRSLKFGIGSFTFAPKAQDTYKAMVNINGKPIIADLPAISPAGYVMGAVDDGDNINIEVTASGMQINTINLLLHSNNIIEDAQSAIISNGIAHFVINKQKLNEGLSYITLFDELKEPICERLIFVRPERTLTITANTDAAQYISRKKVSVNISTQNKEAKRTAANLSMSVYRLDSLQQLNSANIASYLWLSAALKGHIESPNYYFDNNTPESNQALDNLLLSQGWSQFDWSNILANKKAAYNYLPEYTGPIITANLINIITKNPTANINGFLTIPGKYHLFYTAKSDSSGKLLFNTKASFGSKEIVVKTDSRHDSTYRIEVISPFSEQYSTDLEPTFTDKPNAFHSLYDDNINAQVNEIFNKDEIETPKPDTVYFYGKPPYKYNLDDYTRFKTMAELIHEYVRFVSVSYENGQAHLKMSYNKALLPNETTALVDGEPIFEAGNIYKLDPLKIKRLDVINNKYVYGPMVFDGLISLTTYTGDRGNVNLDPKAITIDYEGLQLKRKFYSPVYDTDQLQKSTLPDFRTTLCWKPDINTDKQGMGSISFYTSDKAGKYIGVIEGLTTNGEAGYKQFYFEVKK